MNMWQTHTLPYICTKYTHLPPLGLLSRLPRSPHGGADSLRTWLRKTLRPAAGLALWSGAEAVFEALESLLDLREGSGALDAAVEAGRGDCGRHGLLDKAIHLLARVLTQTRFGEQGGDTLQAGFVAFPVTVCGIWRRGNNCLELWMVGSLKHINICIIKRNNIILLQERNSLLLPTGGMSLRNLTVISRMSAFSSLE